MAIATTIKSVVYHPDGRVTVTFEDDSGIEFASRDELISSVAQVGGREWCRQAMLRAWVERSPDASDPSWAIGRTFQVDLAADLGPVQVGKLG